MSFAQMHERLRLEMLRRIQRGSLSVSLLARQTGFGQSHLSNFLHCRRQLSLDAMDRILSAQQLAASDLMPALRNNAHHHFSSEETASVPVISHNAALFEPFVRASSVQSVLYLPEAILRAARARATVSRRTWQRFIAVRISSADAEPLEPLLMPEALLVIDRHYNSLAQYRPQRPTLYAVRNGPRLAIRYVDFLSNRLVLRPGNAACPVELLETEPGQAPNDLIIGRVALILNEI
ncbi:MAG: hypothetical protein WBD67_05375 [Terracidiphilus sp.]